MTVFVSTGEVQAVVGQVETRSLPGVTRASWTPGVYRHSFTRAASTDRRARGSRYQERCHYPALLTKNAVLKAFPSSSKTKWHIITRYLTICCTWHTIRCCNVYQKETNATERRNRVQTPRGHEGKALSHSPLVQQAAAAEKAHVRAAVL